MQIPLQITIRAVLGIPGEELASTHDRDEDVCVAVRDAARHRAPESKADSMAVGQD